MSFVTMPTPRSALFTHSVDYGDGERPRPIVTVEFAATLPSGQLIGATHTGVKLDSGADKTFLGLEIANRLNLDLTDPNYKRTSATGLVPGSDMQAVETTIKVLLCDAWIDIPVLFSTGMMPVRNVLGREGVFDQIEFSFAHADRVVYATRV